MILVIPLKRTEAFDEKIVQGSGQNQGHRLNYGLGLLDDCLTACSAALFHSEVAGETHSVQRGNVGKPPSIRDTVSI